MGERRGEWLPVLLAAAAFVVFLAAFGWELFAYQRKVVEWARRDLQSRVDLAAANLEEPLRTQDFRKIHAFGDQVGADGYRLSIFAANGRGRVFDTYRNPEADPPQYHADQRCGEYLVRLWIPISRVYAPFWLAVVGFCLAGLVGIAGVLLFFLVTYRQRVRIRELRRTEAFRREFIADVSHEIRTPLTGILGAVDLLEVDSPLVPLIRKEANRLNGLVQSILDLARLEREGETLNLVETDVCELVRETVETLSPAARAAGVELTCPQSGSGDAVRVWIDLRLAAQALSNLVTNAIRHSGAKVVAIAVTADAKSVRIAVEDHGVGIPSAEAGRIFERFHRVDPSRAAETGGAGLGLAIVRRIARLHGGEVTLEPVVPHGCRFVLELPRRRPAVPAPIIRPLTSR